MNLKSRRVLTIGAIVTAVVLIGTAAYLGSRSTSASNSANSGTNKGAKNVKGKGGAYDDDQKLKIKSKIYKPCGDDLKSECGVVDLKITGKNGDKWHRLFFVIDPNNHDKIDSKIEKINGQEDQLKALKTKFTRDDLTKVHKGILNRGFLDFYNDLPVYSQQNLKKNTLFFSIPEDSENFEKMNFEKSVNFDIDGVDKNKKEEIYKWQSYKNFNTIKAELIGNREDENALLGLDIKFYNQKHPNSDLPVVRKTVYEGMHVQYQCNVHKYRNIIKVLDRIKRLGSKNEWFRQNSNSYEEKNLFFHVYIVASPEQRKELFEMVDAIKIDNEFQKVLACGPLLDKNCGVFNLKVKDENDTKDYRIALAFGQLMYSRIEKAYRKNKGYLSREEFLDLFRSQEETKIGETTYLTPQVEAKTDQKQSIVEKMLEISKLAGFKGYVDGFDKNDMDFWNYWNIYLIMPSDSEHGNIVNTHPNGSNIYKAIRYPDSTKNLPVSVKSLLEETYKKAYGIKWINYEYKARVFGIENIFKTEYYGLLIEMSYVKRLLTKNEIGTYFENGFKSFKSFKSFKNVIASYKGMLLYYDYAYNDRNIIKVINAIETDKTAKGLENEFNEQYNVLYEKKGNFPSFKVLLIGKVDDIKAFAKTIGVQDEKWESK